MKRTDPLGLLLAAILGTILSCSGGGNLADNGGMSGTGISQGPITAFGSIFVNGVEWDVEGARIEVDGRPADEADLRVGMVVRVEGDRSGGAMGSAISVVFDDALVGPISDDPVEVSPSGRRKQFTVLGTPVIVDIRQTHFGDGASFDGLARDQVVAISGLTQGNGTIRATRLSLRGTFPAQSEVALRGPVANLFRDSNGGGIFDLGDVVVRYDAGTRFEGVRRSNLADGVFVEVEGSLRISGDEVDAERIERKDQGLGDDDFDDAEIEGFITSFVSNASFVVAGVSVDASSARLEPADLVLADGVQVEVEGRLQGGVLIADEVQGEGDDDGNADEAKVEIRAAVGAVSSDPDTLVLLDVSVGVDNETELEDERDGRGNFRFRDIAVGDWLEVEAIATGAGTARALEVVREEAGADVVFRAPVTALDVDAPELFLLDLPIPIDGMTRYFAGGVERSEDEFFRAPGDVQIGDGVRVSDRSAADPSVLGQADEVEIDDEDG